MSERKGKVPSRDSPLLISDFDEEFGAFRAYNRKHHREQFVLSIPIREAQYYFDRGWRQLSFCLQPDKIAIRSPETSVVDLTEGLISILPVDDLNELVEAFCFLQANWGRIPEVLELSNTVVRLLMGCHCETQIRIARPQIRPEEDHSVALCHSVKELRDCEKAHSFINYFRQEYSSFSYANGYFPASKKIFSDKQKVPIGFWNALVDEVKAEFYIFVLGAGLPLAAGFIEETGLDNVGFISYSASFQHPPQSFIRESLIGTRVCIVDRTYFGTTLSQIRHFVHNTLRANPIACALFPKNRAGVKSADYAVIAGKIFRVDSLSSYLSDDLWALKILRKEARNEHSTSYRREDRLLSEWR